MAMVKKKMQRRMEADFSRRPNALNLAFRGQFWLNAGWRNH